MKMENVISNMVHTDKDNYTKRAYIEAAIEVKDMDALLLTQGWRRYNIPEVAQGWIETPALQVQQSQDISGFLRDVDNRKPILKGSVDSTRYILKAGSAKRREIYN